MAISHVSYYSTILKDSDDGVLYLIKPHFWTLSIVSGYKNITFPELALLPPSGKRGGPIQLGPLEKASLSHWTILVKEPKHYKHLLSEFVDKR
jgi:hypothetical protein